MTERDQERSGQPLEALPALPSDDVGIIFPIEVCWMTHRPDGQLTPCKMLKS
jgi:hypothetical protein